MKRSVSISVYNDEGQILAVTNRRFGGFTLPGGKVEEGEDTEVAAMRELYEETGLVPKALRYLGCSPFSNPLRDKSIHYLVSHFEAIIDDPEPQTMEEGTEPLWVEPNVMFEHEDSIFADHYRQISALNVICSFRKFVDAKLIRGL